MIAARLDPRCEVIICIPACNEEAYITQCLLAVGSQVDGHGVLIDPRRFEILVLVNNSHDFTSPLVQRIQALQPALRLHLIERRFRRSEANVGMARRSLFEIAARRFQSANRRGIIATTDADTIVADSWLEATLRQFSVGADAVAGFIAINPVETLLLPTHTQAIIQADRHYRMLLHRYKRKIERPIKGLADNHYHHTGASLAVTTDAYRRCGGMPVVDTLEDIALVRALQRIDAKISYPADVLVTTSARACARAAAGMGDQLAAWNKSPGCYNLEVASPLLYFQQLALRSELRRLWHGLPLSEATRAQPPQSPRPSILGPLRYLDRSMSLGENWQHVKSLFHEHCIDFKLRNRLQVNAAPVSLPQAIATVGQHLTADCR